MDFSFGKEVIVDVESGVLINIGFGESEFVEDKVVEISSDFELQSAEGVGDVLETVGNAVGEVVERVDEVVDPGGGMHHIPDPVDDRVPESGVAVLVVYFQSQTRCSFFVLAPLHPPEFD